MQPHTTMPTVLIIDDETSLVNSLRFALEDEGYRVHDAATGEAGLRAVAEVQPDLVLLDLRLPDRTGQDVLEDIRRGADAPHVIMISAHGDTRAAVRAVKCGAADYLTKPFDLDELLHVMRSALERGRMAHELQYHRKAVLRQGVGTAAPEAPGRPGAPGLLGSSQVMAELNATIARVAGSSVARVLVLGESGTGKALVARALHAGSPRAQGPFIEVNCASLPEQLIEAELFGAEKGAYTGAHARRTGLVALADGGTLFMDEIGEMPLPLQAKLLHFLENGQFRPIGGSRALSADVRVVTATNRELAAEVVAGRFREDLYYRLNVISLRMPPLRERNGDVVQLAEHFAQLCAVEEKVPPVRFGAVARERLCAYRWPGNVRELKNLVERLTILYPGREIGVAELPLEITQAAAPLPAALTSSVEAGQREPAMRPLAPRGAMAPANSAPITDALAHTERELILQALRDCAGHKGQAADRLGISRHAFKRRLKRLGLAGA
jgi:two-component system, NtrC family, response regulator AtoC